MSIRWKPVVGYEGLYEVSETGDVRSLDHMAQYKSRWGGVVYPMKKRGKVLRRIRNTYPMVNLCKDGATKAANIHALVAEAFLGPRPHGHQVAHNDGDPENCVLVNLRYATAIENNSDKIRHGRHQCGVDAANSKLSESDVKDIRMRYSHGATDALAKEYGVAHSTILRVVSKKTWKFGSSMEARDALSRP